MTYRDRRLARAERLRAWADKRQTKSAAAFRAVQRLADSIPLGQPILVGHHSARHARRDQDRIHNGMTKGLEHADKARSMDARADEIERQADHAIYHDDPDAIEQLEARIASLEAERDRKKAINAQIRKGPGWEARLSPPLTDAEKSDLVSLARCWASVYKPGYPSYAFQNLSGNIQRQRKRLERLTAMAAQRERVRDVLAAEREVEP